jgi:hypothetical protein
MHHRITTNTGHRDPLRQRELPNPEVQLSRLPVCERLGTNVGRDRRTFAGGTMTPNHVAGHLRGVVMMVFERPDRLNTDIVVSSRLRKVFHRCDRNIFGVR